MAKSRIVIVDYGMGNLRSVEKAFERVGAKPQVTSNARLIQNADKIVLPGVGAFTAAVKELKRRKIFDVVRKKILSGAPYLGICLGLQLLFERSEESTGKGEVKGFGIIRGRVKRFSMSCREAHLKIPHMGWNTLELEKKNCPILKGFQKKDRFYFVHSYYGDPKERSWRLARTRHGVGFCSAVWKQNIFATQFHPEKSQAVGLRILKNFTKLPC